VVRHHRAGELLAVHHLAENLENEWDKPTVHREPLVAFFERQLARDDAIAPALITVRDFEAAARERIDPVHFDYVCGAARDELTARANEESFTRLQLLPRVLRGSDKRELGVDLFGSRAGLPCSSPRPRSTS